jgi:hypothetical protein
MMADCMSCHSKNGSFKEGVEYPFENKNYQALRSFLQAPNTLERKDDKGKVMTWLELSQKMLRQKHDLFGGSGPLLDRFMAEVASSKDGNFGGLTCDMIGGKAGRANGAEDKSGSTGATDAR